MNQDKPVNNTKNCPNCGNQGQAIDTATVKSLLSVSLRQVQDTPYRFCATADCDVVYFNSDGKQTFSILEVRERVYQKEPQASDILICYCFQHTTGAIQAEIEATGTSLVIDDINIGIQLGQCACDWRNPQGKCCLGNVRKLVKQHQSNFPEVEA